MARAATREDLRAALWGAPTELQFERVLKVLLSLERRPDFNASQYEGELMRAASEALDGWPSRARRAPGWLLDRLERRESVRGAKLVRSLEIAQDSLGGHLRSIPTLLSRLPLSRLRELTLRGLTDNSMDEVTHQLRLCDGLALESLHLHECLMFPHIHRELVEALPNLKGLALDRVLMEGAHLKTWTAHPGWSALRELTIANSALGREGSYALTNAVPSSLTALDIEHSDVFTDTLQSLLFWPSWQRLTHLGLTGNRTLYRNAWSVLQAHEVSTLRSIDLSGTSVVQDLEPTDAPMTWRCPPERLALRDVGLKRSNVRALMQRLPRGLKALEIDDNPLRAPDIELLLGGGPFEDLRELSLTGCGVPPRDWGGLMSTLSGLRSLRSLRLSSTPHMPKPPLGLYHYAFLPRWWAWGYFWRWISRDVLEEAYLNTIRELQERDRWETRALMRLEQLHLLERLELDGWPIGDEALSLLFETRPRFAMRHLSLRGCGLTDASVEVLASPRLAEIEVLDLGLNPGMSPRGLAGLMALPNLSELWVDGCSANELLDEHARKALVARMAARGVRVWV